MGAKTEDKPVAFKGINHVDAGAFAPMLADKAPKDTSKLVYPILVSPKLDGIRCVIHEGVALSRKLKPIPNKFVQRCLRTLPDGLDGELMLRAHGTSFSAVSSAVMREDGEPDFVYNVFDRFGPGTFQTRFFDLDKLLKYVVDQSPKTGGGLVAGGKRVELVPHRLVSNADELLRIEEAAINDGFEGVMIRSLAGPYKCGRSTTKQGFLLKLKRFEDAEAVIIGTAELMHNMNEATKDALGHTKRSTAKAGKEGGGTLGKLIVARPSAGPFTPARIAELLAANATSAGHPDVFEIGTGYTAAMRAALWEVRSTLVGLMAKYKFQPDPAAPQNKPRFPVYLGIRDPRDM